MLRSRAMRVLIIGGLWALAGLLVAVYEDLVHRTVGFAAAGYSVWRALAFKTLGAGTAGLVASAIVVLGFKGRLRTLPFWAVGLGQGLTFALLALLATTLGTWLAAVDTAVLDIGALTAKNVFFALALGAATSFLIEVNDRFGHGGLLGALSGRYHRARNEVRTFMFLDLTGSTGLAERLGHRRYHELLNDFFADATEGIIATGGEVYQYVGDELVVSWPGRSGLEGAACLRCLDLIQAEVGKNAGRYQGRFGCVPHFRAAFHWGEVTGGEVGILKREIVFTGDTLNTAARLEGLAKELGCRTVLSADVADRLSGTSPYPLREVGTVRLRGRGEDTRVLTADPVASA